MKYIHRIQIDYRNSSGNSSNSTFTSEQWSPNRVFEFNNYVTKRRKVQFKQPEVESHYQLYSPQKPNSSSSISTKASSISSSKKCEQMATVTTYTFDVFRGTRTQTGTKHRQHYTLKPRIDE